jgi:hypothetical protein
MGILQLAAPEKSTFGLNLSQLTYFGIGISSAGRQIAGYVYMMEFVPRNMQSSIGTIWSCLTAALVLLMIIAWWQLRASWKSFVQISVV